MQISKFQTLCHSERNEVKWRIPFGSNSNGILRCRLLRMTSGYMKILFSLTYYSPYISGLTLCVSRIAEGPAKDHEVCVLCMRHDSSLSLEERIGEIRKIRVIRANPILKISKGFLSVDWVIKSWIEVRKSDTVVVNLQQPEGIFPAFFYKNNAAHLFQQLFILLTYLWEGVACLLFV